MHRITMHLKENNEANGAFLGPQTRPTPDPAIA